MKKSFLILAAAAGMFAACTNEDAVLEQPVAQQGETPVLFDAYAGRAVTRAGAVNDVDATSLQTNGFGVFAYFTNNGSYDDTSTPNFMYNQKVDGTSWAYTPVKYWPNEYGNKAISDETDKLTFFAYGPYVTVTPSTGKVAAGDNKADTWGITALSRNTAASDPIVKYIVSFDPTKSVDLVWGTVHADFAGTDKWALTQGGHQTAFTAGLPWLNVERPADATGDGASAQKIKFDFKHATAKLNAQIALYTDVQNFAAGKDVANGTKVYVRQINFTGLTTKASLNLNNTAASKALWLDYAGVNDLEMGESVTLYDGRKDGKEAVPGAVAPNEKQQDLNPVIIQTEAASAGVTGTLVNLFNSGAADKSVFVIPTGEPVDVEIVYDVETADDNLPGYLSNGTNHGSVIENRIRKTAVFTSLENGKAYTLKLYLGMNSVKFDAAVTGWDTTTAENKQDLPANENN